MPVMNLVTFEKKLFINVPKSCIASRFDKSANVFSIFFVDTSS